MSNDRAGRRLVRVIRWGGARYVFRSRMQSCADSEDSASTCVSGRHKQKCHDIKVNRKKKAM